MSNKKVLGRLIDTFADETAKFHFTLKASRPKSPGPTCRMEAAWARSAGWSNGPSVGSATTVGRVPNWATGGHWRSILSRFLAASF